MSRNLVYIPTLLAILVSSFANAQIKVSEDTTNASKKGVFVYADPRLDVLLKKHREVKEGTISSGKGYRVQIYYGYDRAKATEIKIDFMQRYPKIQTYMTYVRPQYRVKAGNFRTREEAAELYKEVNKIYNPCMIVPDIITINTFRDDQ